MSLSSWWSTAPEATSPEMRRSISLSAIISDDHILFEKANPRLTVDDCIVYHTLTKTYDSPRIRWSLYNAGYTLGDSTLKPRTRIFTNRDHSIISGDSVEEFRKFNMSYATCVTALSLSKDSPKISEYLKDIQCTNHGEFTHSHYLKKERGDWLA
jgi:hypothetical protein